MQVNITKKSIKILTEKWAESIYIRKVIQIAKKPPNKQKVNFIKLKMLKQKQ